MATLGKDKKKAAEASASASAAPADKGNSKSVDAVKKSGPYYEVQTAHGKPYRKAGLVFGHNASRVYVSDLGETKEEREAKCKLLEGANPKVLIVRKVEG